MEERNETIIHLVKEGETLRAAGERYGLTRQRVAQIVKGYVDTRKRMNKKKRAIMEKVEAVRKLREEGKTWKEIREQVGVTYQAFYRVVGIRVERYGSSLLKKCPRCEEVKLKKDFTRGSGYCKACATRIQKELRCQRLGIPFVEGDNRRRKDDRKLAY